MTPPAQHDIGVLTVAAALAGWVFGDEVAHLVAAYLVIFAGGVLGAFINAARRPGRTLRADASVFIGIVLAVLLTASTAADLLVRYAGIEPSVARSGIGVIAIVLGAIGEDWLRIGRWALNLARGVIEAFHRRPRTPGDQP